MSKSQDKTVDWFFNIFGLIAVLVSGYWAISLATGTIIPSIVEPYIGYISGGLGLIWALGEMFREKSTGNNIFKDADWAFNTFALAMAIMGGIIVYSTYYTFVISTLLVYAYTGGLVIWMGLEWIRS